MFRNLSLVVLVVTLGACSSLPGIAANEALIPDVCEALPQGAVGATLGVEKPGKLESRITEIEKSRSCSWDSGTGISLTAEIEIIAPDTLRTSAEQYLNFKAPAKNPSDDPKLPAAQTTIRPIPELGPNAYIRTDVVNSVSTFTQRPVTSVEVGVRIDDGDRTVSISAYWANAEAADNEARATQMITNAGYLLGATGSADDQGLTASKP